MWNKPLHHSLETLYGIATVIASKVECPSLRSYLMLLIGLRHTAELAELQLPPSAPYSVLDRLYALQVIALFSKNQGLDLGQDTRAVAMGKWFDAEDLCRKTNERLRAVARGEILPPPGVAAIIHSAQRKIAKVLGPVVPCISTARMVFTAGASTCIPKRNACSRTKLDAQPECSTNLYPVLTDIFNAWPLYAEFHASESTEEKWVIPVSLSTACLQFVPKNAKTDRAVMVEPPLNLLVQKVYGDYIRRKLARVGIDLTDQSINRGLARSGSLTGALATLDLSSASDTISRELVNLLLPVDWYLALNTCRSPIAMVTETLDDPSGSTDVKSEVRLEKFSSMGNGFTFPLQSLIFWALTQASTEATESKETAVSVYGDDIICPVEVVPLLKSVFDFCGFVLNESKSYWEGPFRESCGGDYYLGVNVRPLYVKEALTPKGVMALHNYVYRNGDYTLAAELLTFLPKEYHIYGPDGYGDGHLLGDWTPRPFRRDAQYGGWLFDTYRETGSRHRKVLAGDALLPAYSVYVSDGNSECGIPETGKGVKSLPLPGVSRCERVTIYTLSPR